MLTVFFHPGPYKTGTTSIQQYLRRTIGSESPQRVWYPMTTGASPGHVDVFKDLNGRNEQYCGLLERWIETAKESQVEKLIISQEDFSTSKPEVLENIRAVCSGTNVHLIMTHRSLKKRVISQWQEFVKHGATHTIDDLSKTLKMRRFKPDLLQKIAKYLLPDEISIVTSGVDESGDRLIRRFIDCLKIDEYVRDFGREIDSNLRINISHGRVETEFIRHLNIMSNYLDEVGIEHDYKFMRRSLVNMMQSERWREKVNRLPIELPAMWEDKVHSMAQELFECLYADFHDGKIRVYGDLSHLLQ
ncbi:hypothetical protein ACFL0R_03740 [Pseudomonadota bacterium]